VDRVNNFHCKSTGKDKKSLKKEPADLPVPFYKPAKEVWGEGLF